MARVDYRCCDVCGIQTIYDANLHWNRNNTNDCIYTYNNRSRHRRLVKENNKPTNLTLGHLGNWAVLCLDCAKKYEFKIVPITKG